MKTLFVDMDGVLSDFDARYQSEFGKLPQEVRDHKERGEYSRLWNKFIDDQNFKSLPYFDGAEELIEFINELTNVRVCILTSSGGFDRHRDVQEQKLFWLRSRGIKWPAIVVPGRRFKARFTDGQQTALIDDTFDVIQSFNNAGGLGIHHKPHEKWNTYYQVEQWLR